MTKVICAQNVWTAVPAEVSRFVQFGWSNPDEDGYRRWSSSDPGSDGSELQLITQFVNQGLLDRGTAQPTLVVVGDGAARGGLRVEMLWSWQDQVLSTAFTLAETWSLGRDIGTCNTCGNVFSPIRNRPTRFCSTACRVKAHNSKDK